jgi:hypothetical protein
LFFGLELLVVKNRVKKCLQNKILTEKLSWKIVCSKFMCILICVIYQMKAENQCFNSGFPDGLSGKLGHFNFFPKKPGRF